MFSFFRKKEKAVQVNDYVWMNEQQKMTALMDAAKEDASNVFICWFDETRDKLAQLFADNSLSADNIYLALEVSRHHTQRSKIFFAEHHPLHEKEQALYKELQLEMATVHSSLDEPILQKFGGERIISLMQSLGVAETESLQHKLISASIKNAQDKLTKKVVVEQPARSQQEWIQRNTG